MDERYGTTGYQTMHYGGISISNMMILEGKIIVSNRNTAHTNNGWWAIDLYTGETIGLYNDTVMPSFASIYNYESPNLFQLLKDARPARINKITIYAAGHDYDSRVADLALTVR